MFRSTLVAALAGAVAGLCIGCGHGAGPPAPRAEAVALDPSVPCTALAQAKYPFLTCEKGADGQPVFVDAPQPAITKPAAAALALHGGDADPDLWRRRDRRRLARPARVVGAPAQVRAAARGQPAGEERADARRERRDLGRRTAKRDRPERAGQRRREGDVSGLVGPRRSGTPVRRAARCRRPRPARSPRRCRRGTRPTGRPGPCSGPRADSPRSLIVMAGSPLPSSSRSYVSPPVPGASSRGAIGPIRSR